MQEIFLAIGLFLLGIVAMALRIGGALVLLALLMIALNRTFPHVMVMSESHCVQTPLNMYAGEALITGDRCWYGIPTVVGLGLSGLAGDS